MWTNLALLDEGDFSNTFNWSVSDFFGGAAQVFYNAFETVVSWLPNPDPFPEMIEQMEPGGDGPAEVAWWWLDTAFDIYWCYDIVGAWLEMMVTSILIGIIVKAILAIWHAR